MKTSIVIGAGFGDEGKGLTTSYLCSLSERPLVVRFSGGHNAGHTVIHGGKRHVFSSFGSGTLQDAPTYWSKNCTFNPPGFMNEYNALMKNHGKRSLIYVDTMCPVTTPFDIHFNHTTETLNQHGSVGVGLGTTIQRHHENNYRLHVMDLFHPYVLQTKLKLIKEHYGNEMQYLEQRKIAEFIKAVELVKDIIIPVNGMPSVAGYDHVIFEGSQGILLDQEFGFFPHVTRSHTSSKNAMELIRKYSLHMHGNKPEVYYITRSYQTRHGNGPMSNEDKPVKLVNNEGETNVSVEWQGDFRTGILDLDLLKYAIDCDSIYAGTARKNLVVTCLDQTGETFNGTTGGKIVSLDPDKLVNFLSLEPFHSLLTSSSPHTEQVVKHQYRG